MKKQQKSTLVLAIITAFMATALLVSAGDLEPSGPPTTGTMHTLDEIYNKLAQLVPGVEKTGQTTSYSATDGEDGDLQKGVAWPVPRFTDNEDGTVTDNLTGLIWLKNANRFGLKEWAVALSDCNDLADGGDLTDGSVAGDWRLPNVKELHSLIHYGFYGPAVPNTDGTVRWTDGDPFTGVQSGGYWSSTTYEYNTDYAWTVLMFNGVVNGNVKPNGYYVWPVRGGN